MAKFKVGDKVRVRTGLEVDREYNDGCTFVDDMVPHMGNTATITSAWDYRGEARYKINTNRWTWTDNMLELVESVVFAKADLKDGMVVEIRKGHRYILLNGKLVNNKGSFNFSDIKDDLTDKDLPESFSIDKVYISRAIVLKHLFESSSLELIWERPKEEPVKEMTVAEIEKELGYKVKVVAEE